MNDVAEQKIVQHLFEAHGAELMQVHTLTAHIAMTPAGAYRDGLELHLRETRDHAERIERHLARRERERGLMQVGYGAAQGVVGQVLAMGKFPMDLMRGMSGEEKLLKNCRDECATEAMEIASYTAIEQLATSVGDTETARLASSIRKDEEAMLERLLKLIPQLASDVVSAEVEGSPKFDMRRIGAVDAVRDAAGNAARKVARSANRTARDVTKKPTAKRSPSPAARKATRSGGAATVSSNAASKPTTTRSTSGSSTKRTTAKKTGTKRTTAKRSTSGTSASSKGTSSGSRSTSGTRSRTKAKATS